MADADQLMAEIAARTGVDLAAVTAHRDPVLHPDGWIDDPVAWRTETAEALLARLIPAGFAGARLQDCPPPVTLWAQQHVADPQAYPRLLLLGRTGTGKTHAAWALLRHLVMGQARQGLGYDFRFVTQADLNDEVRPKPDHSHAYAVERYLRTRLLVFDDIGAGNLSDYTIECTLRIINYRYDMALPTIYTTNETPARIAQLMGSRIYSRLFGADDIVLTGPDRRLDAGR